jgi:hypothetical protein
MKNSEEAIEKVLMGLRDADVPVGMERRILDGLEKRAAVRGRSGWRQLLPVWLVAPARPFAVGVVLAGVFSVALAIPAIRRLGHAPVQARRNSAPVESLSAANSEVAKSAQPGSRRPSVRSLEEVNAGGQKEAETRAGGTAAALDSDSVALEEMHAASQPAPPMPLTEQERLLLRLVHKDDPVELAMLDSKMRALQDSEDKAEFQRFFGQSTKQAAPEQTMTEQGAPQPSATEQVAPGQSATEEAMPAEPETEQATPEQPVPEQPVQQPSTPETSAPDHSTTQQTTPRPTRTGDNK